MSDIMHTQYYIRPSPSSTPSFEEFDQELWVWLTNKWLSQSHDILDKSMSFELQLAKLSIHAQISMKLGTVCSKGGHLRCNIPN